VDLVVLPLSDATVEVAGLRMRGELFWVRLAGSTVVRAIARNARSLSAGRERLLDAAESVPWFDSGVAAPAVERRPAIRYQEEPCAAYPAS
jgi:hypothetical protein